MCISCNQITHFFFFIINEFVLFWFLFALLELNHHQAVDSVKSVPNPITRHDMQVARGRRCSSTEADWRFSFTLSLSLSLLPHLNFIFANIHLHLCVCVCVLRKQEFKSSGYKAALWKLPPPPPPNRDQRSHLTYLPSTLLYPLGYVESCRFLGNEAILYYCCSLTKALEMWWVLSRQLLVVLLLQVHSNKCWSLST